jgi:hypothetical protein
VIYARITGDALPSQPSAFQFPRPAARKSDRAFATPDASEIRRSPTKRDAVDQRGIRAGIWNRRGWNRRCAGTLLVAAIIAPLRRFDT